MRRGSNEKKHLHKWKEEESIEHPDAMNLSSYCQNDLTSPVKVTDCHCREVQVLDVLYGDFGVGFVLQKPVKSVGYLPDADAETRQHNGNPYHLDDEFSGVKHPGNAMKAGGVGKFPLQTGFVAS